MAVTMADITKLRKMSGAGMMDCKKALTESDGDIEKAMEIIRKKGQAIAAKRSDRDAAEGCVLAKKDGGFAAVIALKCETDFVAKNEEFQKFVAAVAKQALATSSTDIDAFLAENWNEDSSKTVKDALVEKVAVIGENLTIRRFEKVVAENGCVVSYTHGGGRIGVIVEAETAVVNETVKEALVNLAMQIAALYPKYISTEEVSEEYKAHEKEILMEQIKNDPKMAGKPDKVIEGAVNGRLAKELKEVCLLEQVYVKAEDGKQTVKQYINTISKEVGTDITIKKFVRFETGEGLEKKQDDFAAEVAAQLG